MHFPWRNHTSFGIIDTLVIIVIGICLSWFFYRMATVLDYTWDWGVIPGYLVRIDSESGYPAPNILLQGFFTTIRLSFWSSILAVCFGAVFGVIKAKGTPGLKFLAWMYVETIRNIPSLVLMFLFYFFISSVFLDALGMDRWLRSSPEPVKGSITFLFAGEKSINAFASAMVALAIYEGAYVTEIIRGGLSGIPEGQWEAASALGMKPYQTYLWVILPQVFRNVLSPLAGQCISTIKDSAIVSVISIQELTFQGLELMSATFLTFEVWITVAFLYFIITFSLSRCVAVIEKRFSLQS